jgi:hypothetical protein
MGRGRIVALVVGGATVITVAATLAYLGGRAATLNAAEEQVTLAEGRINAIERQSSQRVADAEAAMRQAKAVARAEVEAEYAQRQEQLAERSRELDEREAAIARAEEIAKKSTFGNGVYDVGVDVVAGTYAAAGGPGCYWELNGGVGGQDLIDNHFQGGEGQVLATLSDGQRFSTNGCGTWQRRG